MVISIHPRHAYMTSLAFYGSYPLCLESISIENKGVLTLRISSPQAHPAPPPCGAISPGMMSEVSTDSCVRDVKALGLHFLPLPPRLPSPSLIMEFPMTSLLLGLACYIPITIISLAFLCFSPVGVHFS